jgi:predicted nucleotidyltransferase
MYHYLNMAKGNFREYLQGEQVRIKKYFYVLRPILACGWIEKHDSMPPMEFARLLEALVPGDSELRNVVEKLLERKKAGDELDLEPRLNPIHEYLRERFEYYERTAVCQKAAEGGNDAELDALFREALREVWLQPPTRPART